MIISDAVYGEFEIENIFKELIDSKPVQRLKKIHQGGASYLVNAKWDNNRYDHSVGVMLLVRKLGGSIEEQIAGLLHDISHTAFSHVIDFVFDNEEEDYHEEIYTKIVEESEIPSILKKYGYDYEDILLDMDKWSILEKPTPDLCADRIDYTLRDLLHHNTISQEEIDNFIKSLQFKNEHICISSIEQAKWFVEIYHKLVFDYFMHPLNIYGSEYLSKTLKLALKNNIITLDDFLKDDESLIDILKKSKNTEVNDILNKINSHVKVEVNEKTYQIHRKTKLRIVDPYIYTNFALKRSSELSAFILNLNNTGVDKSKKGVYINILSY